MPSERRHITYDDDGNVIRTQSYAGDFEPVPSERQEAGPGSYVICLHCWTVIGIDGEQNPDRPTTICSHLHGVEVVPREHLEQAVVEIRLLNGRLDTAKQRLEQAEARCQQLEETLNAIDLHGEMPAGESWEVAYGEVLEIARAALRGQPVGGDET